MTIQEDSAEIKKRFEWDASTPDFVVSPGRKGAIVGSLDKACGGTANRKLFMTGRLSSKDLTEGQWFALKEFEDAQKFGDLWLPREWFERDCKIVLEAMAHQEGQEEMVLE
ncbi:MAG: hypothetical protein WC714_28810 [Candidatus Obscuribacterales bacterium]|jgi:hypothetical protein